MEKLTITVPEMARLIGCSLPSAYELARREGFPVLRIGRKVLIPYDAFKEWLNNNKI